MLKRSITAIFENAVMFLQKTLTSRKFYAAVAAAIPFYQAGNWESFAMVCLAYVGIQGVEDSAKRIAEALAKK